MKMHIPREIILALRKKAVTLALVGFALIALGTVLPLGYLTWVGVWTVVTTLFIHYYKIRKEAQRQGKEVVF